MGVLQEKYVELNSQHHNLITTNKKNHKIYHSRKHKSRSNNIKSQNSSKGALTESRTMTNASNRTTVSGNVERHKLKFK